MSEVKRYTGKLIQIYPKSLETNDEWVKRLIKESGCKMPDYNNVPEDPFVWLDDACWRKYIIHKGQVFKVLESIEHDPYDYFAEAKKMTNGEINFHVMYYDGGSSLDETICEALENIKEE